METNGYYIKNGFSLFWGGFYSQWDEVSFTYENMKFNCAEQFMMYFKALVCNDIESAALIMKTSSPREQKALGKKVKDFSEDIWTEEVSMAVVYIGNYLKFTQNKEYLDYIIKDPSKEIVEASPYDKIWGIGLGVDRPQAWHKNSWRGENRLGRCLTDVRELLLNHIPDSVELKLHQKRYKIVNDIFDLRIKNI